ncbi:hypothetical protein LINPERHAP1_LOCUS24260, partial [Linum perenne]
LSKQAKVRGRTPKVAKQEKKRPFGRAVLTNREQYNRKFVIVGVIPAGCLGVGVSSPVRSIENI